MKQYKQIVCPIDFSKSSEAVLQSALDFKKISSAKLTVVHFIEPLPAAAYGAGAAIVDMEESMLRDAQSNMEAMREKYHLDKAEIKIERNYPKRAISELAEKLGGDLIVIGGHSYHGFMSGLLGSTASATVNHASCDVFVVR